MATNVEFTIIKGKALDFYIIVKENGSVNPLVLSGSDQFVYSLVDKATGQIYADEVSMTIVDANLGKVKGTISSLVSVTLPLKESAPEDGFLARANLRLVVNGVTTAQGSMTAIIENVYVVVG